jgi:hypothetical protein
MKGSSTPNAQRSTLNAEWRKHEAVIVRRVDHADLKKSDGVRLRHWMLDVGRRALGFSL